MGAAKKPSGFAGRGCDERSCPSFLSDPDWGKCDERPQGLVRAGPTGSRPSLFQSPRGTESVHDGEPSMQRFDRWARKLEPSGFRFPPCALGRVGCWMPGCRERGPRRFAMLRLCSGCSDFRSGRILQQLRRQRLPLPSPGGPRRWAITIPSVSGGLEVTSGMRASKNVTAGETNYS